MAFATIIAETRGRAGIVTFNRPRALNALTAEMLGELAQALDAFEADEAVGAIVLTGNEKAFVAGTDIAEIRDRSPADLDDFVTRGLDRLRGCRKPTIAAVAGYALGSGCEIAMICDFAIAAPTAKFGQSEITIGTLPCAGGTQRLVRAVGKAKAMEMCLTGRLLSAEDAERAGLVSRVVPTGDLIDEAVSAADTIGRMSALVVDRIREAVNRAFETTLAEGLAHERELYRASFGTADQKEGMDAFLEKRQPHFTNR
jgi:enoyl-CoA hydratase